jgi:hypothetical protein
MSFDVANLVAPAATCSSCGASSAVFVVTVRRRGDFRACPQCHSEYLAQCAQNRKDEERERREREERIAKQHERDAARNEKRRAS